MSALSKEVLSECAKFELNIVGVLAARWKGYNEKKISVGPTVFEVLCSGESGSHFARVTVILGPKATNALCSWKPVNGRFVCKICF
ncbi:hypothetical protein QYM36_000793 [Artemia franciscana]|uniref:Uncharacterized protein n=1 Tax=Artemia franciscana TaxID=6661 RepID=A0AA88LDJ1_ARTSF|nr:hypothetical protein QYM36_000793 [Artemia franciscana]